MALTDAEVNRVLDLATPGYGWASLHTSAPNSSGSNEVSGGSPAYARQAVTWDAATGKVTAIAGSESFNVPASTTVSHVGLWSASTAGTFRGADALSSSESFTGQGVYELTALTITGTAS